MPPKTTHSLFVVEFRSGTRVVRFTTNVECADDALYLFRHTVQRNYVDARSVKVVPLSTVINTMYANQTTTGYFTNLQNESFRTENLGALVPFNIASHRIHLLNLLIAD